MQSFRVNIYNSDVLFPKSVVDHTNLQINQMLYMLLWMRAQKLIYTYLDGAHMNIQIEWLCEFYDNFM